MSDMLEKFISEDSKGEAREAFMRAVDAGLDFKVQKRVRQEQINDLPPEQFIDVMPEEGKSIDEVQQEFANRFLPYSYNFASPNFMGFPDAGNSIAAIAGSITADLLQQNLINQSFCSTSATFAEIAVIKWLREIVGYDTSPAINSVFDAGGVITGGGTTSNTIGILLARENFKPNTMKNGVAINDDYYLVVPKGIGHYSVKSAQMWLGLGNRLLEVATKDYRYDLDDLERTLKEYHGKVMCVVAYAGDSRTMTVEYFDKVASLVRSIDPSIWLHADACHGFSLGFSDKLAYKLAGIEEFDSITTDPHKVMNAPYTISALLVKDPQKFKTVSSTSDLIMQEQFAFGQITPFIGSKPWSSLKLWFAFMNLGKKGLGELIDERHALALRLQDMVADDPDFELINKVDINSVAFVYTGNQHNTIETLNNLNQQIHGRIIEEGVYHLHQFSIPDAGLISEGEVIYPLRFMSGNPLTSDDDLRAMLEYVRQLGRDTRV